MFARGVRGPLITRTHTNSQAGGWPGSLASALRQIYVCVREGVWHRDGWLARTLRPESMSPRFRERPRIKTNEQTNEQGQHLRKALNVDIWPLCVCGGCMRVCMRSVCVHVCACTSVCDMHGWYSFVCVCDICVYVLPKGVSFHIYNFSH